MLNLAPFRSDPGRLLDASKTLDLLLDLLFETHQYSRIDYSVLDPERFANESKPIFHGIL